MSLIPARPRTPSSPEDSPGEDYSPGGSRSIRGRSSSPCPPHSHPGLPRDPASACGGSSAFSTYHPAAGRVLPGHPALSGLPLPPHSPHPALVGGKPCALGCTGCGPRHHYDSPIHPLLRHPYFPGRQSPICFLFHFCWCTGFYPFLV